jgi:alkylation response protein AidB-like acyl-CoA dehydrogenase
MSVGPSGDVLGTRASHLAELRLEDCRIAAENRVGGLGFGISVVAAAALDLGRYSVAWGCVGAARACLEASLDYADGREQFGTRIGDHQLVAAMLTDMVVGVQSARLLCLQAGLSRQAGEESAGWHASIAKYHASRQFARAAADAVQIHGASGCHQDFPVERLYRDAKVMEIIEGTSEIHQARISPALRGRREWM